MKRDKTQQATAIKKESKETHKTINKMDYKFCEQNYPLKNIKPK